MSRKFQVYYTNEHTKNRTDVIVVILEEECKSFDLIEDLNIVYRVTRGTSQIAIFYLGRYIGYSYRDLVKYLNDNGLMLC